MQQLKLLKEVEVYYRRESERAHRAAQELMQHDFACAVLKAGPTTPARWAELCRREDAVGSDFSACAPVFFAILD